MTSGVTKVVLKFRGEGMECQMIQVSKIIIFKMHEMNIWT